MCGELRSRFLHVLFLIFLPRLGFDLMELESRTFGFIVEGWKTLQVGVVGSIVKVI
jgi:hypothetical protein